MSNKLVNTWEILQQFIISQLFASFDIWRVLMLRDCSSLPHQLYNLRLFLIQTGPHAKIQEDPLVDTAFFRQLTYILEIQKPTNYFSQFCRGRIPLNGFNCFWNSMAHSYHTRTSSPYQSTLYSLLWQRLCSSHRKQIFLPWAHKVYWLGLSHYKRKASTKIIPPTTCFFNPKYHWHSHETARLKAYPSQPL